MKATIEGWVARDKDDTLCLYPYTKPEKDISEWDGIYPLRIDKVLFPSVKWEDSEPTKCKLTIEI